MFLKKDNRVAKVITYHQPDRKFLREIGIKIRQLREQRSLSLEVLSGLSGISYKYLQEVETAKYSVTVSVLRSITQALGISLAEFFSLLSGDHNGAYQYRRCAKWS